MDACSAKWRAPSFSCQCLSWAPISFAIFHESKSKEEKSGPNRILMGGVLGSDEEESILAEGAIALSVTLSGGALFAN